ncbi:MAG: ribose-5-phosphate isomerase RpiA [Pseudomonadota bacterium]
MSQEALKKAAAEAAVEYIDYGSVLGVGSGSTVNYFIDALKKVKGKIEAAVAGSQASADRLRMLGIAVVDLNSLTELPVYVDGADEINPYRQMIKGGGGALTREKIIAAVATKFICIADQSKQVDLLGKFPVPLEVIPMARSYVARQIMKLGANPIYRQGYVTDNANVIIDVHNLKLVDPVAVETTLNNIAGVVTNGLFAQRRADILLLASADGVQVISQS